MVELAWRPCFPTPRLVLCHSAFIPPQPQAPGTAWGCPDGDGSALEEPKQASPERFQRCVL